MVVATGGKVDAGVVVGGMVFGVVVAVVVALGVKPACNGSAKRAGCCWCN